jgi:hypothetical protein
MADVDWKDVMIEFLEDHRTIATASLSILEEFAAFVSQVDEKLDGEQHATAGTGWLRR